MSGSPVYAEDGRLIGAVSYGLAFGPSPVAGVTLAADMQQLLGDVPASTLKPSRRVDIPERRRTGSCRRRGQPPGRDLHFAQFLSAPTGMVGAARVPVLSGR